MTDPIHNLVPGGSKIVASLLSRFWSRVSKGEGEGCWEWTGSVDRDGYGQIVSGSPTSGTFRQHRAHRLSWQLVHGPISSDEWVLHLCDNPCCVRPDHLILGDHVENVKHMHERGRTTAGSKNPRSKLTEEIVTRMRIAVAGGVSYTSLTERYGVSSPAVGMAVRGETWSHVATPTAVARRRRKRIVPKKALTAVVDRFWSKGETWSHVQ